MISDELINAASTALKMVKAEFMQVKAGPILASLPKR
jgi:hypothetical protein